MRASGGIAYELPKMQIQVREADYQTATITMEKVKQYLDGRANQVIDETNYYWIEVLGEPFHLKDDELGRPIFACNFEVKKARTTLA